MARRRARRRRGTASTHSVIGTAAALGVTGLVIANDFGGTGGSPIQYAMNGDYQNTFRSLSGNISSPTIVTPLVVGLVAIAAAAAIHRKFGRSTRVTRKWSLA